MNERKRKMKRPYPKTFRLGSGIVPVMAIFLLGACSGSSNNVDSPDTEQAQAIAPFSAEVQLQTFESVAFSQLAPIEAEDIETVALRSVHYAGSAECAEAWQTTTFEFDGQGAVSAQLCRNIQFSANYALDSGLLVLSNIALDEIPVGDGVYELWGRIGDAAMSNGWRACFATIDVDTDGLETLVDAGIEKPALLPPLEALTFDCDSDEYFFLEESAASQFSARQQAG